MNANSLYHTATRIFELLQALTACLLLALPMSMTIKTQAHEIDWAAHKKGPRGSASVYWVGHSLMESKAETADGPINMMSLVGAFARSRGLQYEMGDHTLWGSPLSALWRGKPYGYEHDAAAAMAEKRRQFEKEAAKYDTIILTEAIPLPNVIKNEYSAYYLRLFYCTLKNANPDARVYLYQSWIHYQASDPEANYPPAELFDWRKEMVKDRRVWEELALTARLPKVPKPNWHSAFWSTTTDAGCGIEDPIFISPVGQAMSLLADRLATPEPADDFTLANGSKLAMADLFANPYVETAAGGITGANKQTLRDPAKPHDDIHPSATGIYFAALVHYAVIYRQSPVGLPDTLNLGKPIAKTLQCIAWEAVISDRMAGVSGEKTC